MEQVLRRAPSLVAAAAILASCGPEGAPAPAAGPSPLAERCAPDDGGLALPSGFCALVAAEGLGPARHVVVAPGGEVFVGVEAGPGGGQGVVALRDGDGDGFLDRRERWGAAGAAALALAGDGLFVASASSVLRHDLPAGSLSPLGDPDTVVVGPLAGPGAGVVGLAAGPAGELYVAVAAASDACQDPDGPPRGAGLDPCPELEAAAGVWRFPADRARRTLADGTRVATGLRSLPALAADPATGALYGVQQGRGGLGERFPELFEPAAAAAIPAEELVRIMPGDDYGWPYCYYDPAQRVKVLAPEYGGDGRRVGRCGEAKPPLLGLPARWGPAALVLHDGAGLPPPYQGGAFVAFRGDLGGAEPSAVVFVPLEDGRPAGEGVPFALVREGTGPFRFSGVAAAPDGSLYVLDGEGGTLWRVVYRGG